MNRNTRNSIALQETTDFPSTDELAARREMLGGQQPRTVLVVDTDPTRIANLRRWAGHHPGVRVSFASSSGEAVDITTRERPEVVVLDLLFKGGRGIALAIQLARIGDDLELLLMADDAGAPEVQAAWDLGWHRLVAWDEATEWLDRGLEPLAALVSLKRQMASARREADALCAGSIVPGVGATALPLGEAERRYREMFLRSKLALAGGRRQAAEMAGVPYTTFCVMLRKLGIRH
jgi:CheY-like chemotaxis protein